MSSARLLVRAVVVSDGRSALLPEVLAAVAAQSVRPDVVHVVTPAGSDHAAAPEGLEVDRSVDLGADYGASVDAVLAAHPAHSRELLWLLHDDTAPLPDALALLVAAAKRRTAAAVIAPAQVRWDDTSRLVGLGISTTRVGARRIDLVDEDDINQGQYDEREDVLGASLAGALVRREAWERLGGVEPAYRGYGSSLHLCRRAWSAGDDVVIVPTALMRHAQEGLDGLRDGGRGRAATYGLRRTGEWLHALSWSRLPWVPLLLVWMFLSALARAVLRIAQNESRMVGADLAVPWRVLARLPAVPGMRARIRRGASRPRSAVRPFLVGVRGVATHVRSRELRAYDRWKAASAPTDMVAQEVAAAGLRRRAALGGVLVAAITVSVLLHGTWLRALIGGRMLAGEALGVTDVPLSYLWERTWSGWTVEGLGAPAIDGAFAALMLSAAALPGGTRVWIGLLLGLGVALAAMSAWFASGAATRSLWARALIALAYGLWPLHLQAISDGRVGAVVAHVMLPWAALAIARAAGWHRGEAVGDGEEHPPVRLASPSAAMGAAFSSAVIVVAAPVLLVPLVAAIVVAGAFARSARWRVWSAVAAPLIVSGPAMVAAWEAGPLTSQAWAILAREPGPALASGVTAPWRILLGLTDHSRGVPGLDLPGTLVVGAVGLAVVAAAALALLSGRAPARVAAGLGVAAVGLTVAVAAQRTVVVPATATGAEANGFAGPGSSLMVLGLLTAVAAASFRAWDAGAGRARAGRRLALSLGIVAACGVIAAAVVVEAWPGRAERGDVHPVDARVLPLVATLEQDLPTRQRVLVVADTDAGVRYSLLETDGTVLLAGRADRALDGSLLAGGSDPGEVLEPLVTLLAGSWATAQQPLAEWGVGVVVAAPGSTQVGGALSQMAGLRLIGASEYGTSYRVPRTAGDAPVSRAWIETGGTDAVVLDSDGRGGEVVTEGLEEGRLIVAVPDADGWQASADGVALERVDDALGRVAFAVPAGAAHVAYEYADRTYRVWWWAAVVAVGWAMIGMIPLHDRRHRAVRR
ncbi:glycosyltransferase [Demequina lignilytica]|uniref:Glycosyltransferase n=1 Tax=Demequina lignilytica TaxID=3051663 RepID=A0AB35MFX7_9MICO|nr:glycosyltransferase [Demequina sp. SYSU T0a273]MDN4482659.1 glycosyltransferase [Demequina sp. SYSU T0a273]